jgi:diguanylate cyclase (GGDEF)-like protein
VGTVLFTAGILALIVNLFIFFLAYYYHTHSAKKNKEVLKILSAFDQGQEEIFDLEKLTSYILTFLLKVTGSPRGGIFLYYRQRNELRLASSQGIENTNSFPPLFTENAGNWALQVSKALVPLHELNTPLFEKTFPSFSGRLKKEKLFYLAALMEKNYLLGFVALDKEAVNLSLDLLEPLSNMAGKALESFYLYETSVTDETTGLYNKRFFRQALQAELLRSNRYQQPLGLLTFDIDDFKKINDTYGHPQGDRVLKELALCVLGCLREGIDIAARTGGEEFYVILPATNLEQAAKAGERIREAISQHPFPGFPDHRKVTISLGIAVYPFHAKDEESLIGLADKALYSAKGGGKNRVCMASESRITS